MGVLGLPSPRNLIWNELEALGPRYSLGATSGDNL